MKLKSFKEKELNITESLSGAIVILKDNIDIPKKFVLNSLQKLEEPVNLSEFNTIIRKKKEDPIIDIDKNIVIIKEGKKGKDGLIGEVGPQGIQGPKGDKGDIGPQGIQGPKGDKGDIGPQGIQGPKGDRGYKGEIGPQGIQGPQGITGLKGEKGSTGEIGPQGIQGPKGDKGDKGDSGSQGIQGLIGPQGIQGPIGPKGDKGDVGIQGLKGSTGEIGPQGPKGDKGDKGDIGPQGIQGLKGDKGDVGPKGIQGLIGPKGDKGDIGPQGIQGLKGEQGIPGLKGEDGFVPDHQYLKGQLRFQNPDGKWGEWINLKRLIDKLNPQPIQTPQPIIAGGGSVLDFIYKNNLIFDPRYLVFDDNTLNLTQGVDGRWILSSKPSNETYFYTETFTVTDTNTYKYDLFYTAIPESEHVHLNRLFLYQVDEYNIINNQLVIITDLKVGDKITIKYATRNMVDIIHFLYDELGNPLISEYGYLDVTI